MITLTDRKNLVATINGITKYDELEGSIVWALQELRRRRGDVRWRICYVEVGDSTAESAQATAWVELITSTGHRQNMGEATGVDEEEVVLRAVLEALNPLLQVELGNKVVVTDPEEPSEHPAYSI